MNFEFKSRHIISSFQKRSKRSGFLVKKREMDNPQVTQKDNMLQDVFKDCLDKYFHTFEYRCD